ncbi:MAG: hypothetical protein QXL43_04755, partial [Methanolinea sp.]
MTQGVRIDLISSEKLEKLTSMEKVHLILDHVRQVLYDLEADRGHARHQLQRGVQGGESQPGVDKLEVGRHEKRHHHGRHLAPGVDAPPKPPEQKDQAGSGPDLQQDLKRLEGVLQPQGDPSRQDDEGQGGEPTHLHIVTFR